MAFDASKYPPPKKDSPFYELHTHLLEVVTSDSTTWVNRKVLEDAFFAARVIKDDALDAAIPSTAPLLATALGLDRVSAVGDDNEFDIAIGILDRIMGRDSVTLETIIKYVEADAFQPLLDIPFSPKATLLAIKILQKGVESEHETGWLAQQELMLKMVKIWLRGETEVSLPMERLLYNYLEADALRGPKGYGRLWGQLLESRPVYLYILETCSWKSYGIEDMKASDLLKSTRTTCQGRLLSLLAKLCRVNYPALVKKSMWRDLHENFHSRGDEGLLGYAINLIDRKDTLAFIALIDFATEAFENASHDKPRTRDAEDPLGKKVLVELAEFMNSPEIHLTEEIFSAYLSSSENTAPDNAILPSDLATVPAVRFITKYANCFIGGFADEHWFSDKEGTKVRARRSENDEEFNHSGSMLDFVLPIILRKLNTRNKRISKPTLLMLTGLPIQYFLPVSTSDPFDRSVVTALSITSPDPNQSRALAHFFNPPAAPMLGRLYYATWMEAQRRLYNVHDPLNMYSVIHRRANDASNIEMCFASIELFKSIVLAEAWFNEPPHWIRPGLITETLEALKMGRLARTGMKELINLRSPLEDMIRLPKLEGHAPYRIRPRDAITSSDPDIVKMLKARYSLVELIDAVLRKFYHSDPAFGYFEGLCRERLERGVEGLDNCVPRRPDNGVQAVTFT